METLPQVDAIQMEATHTKMDIFGNFSWEASNRSPDELNFPQAATKNCSSPSTTSGISPPSPSSCPFPSNQEEFGCGDVHILTQKLISLKLQTRETGTNELRMSPLESSCLLTPPNTPQMLDPVDLLKSDQNLLTKADSEIYLQSSSIDPLSEGTIRHFYISAQIYYPHMWSQTVTSSDGSRLVASCHLCFYCT